MCTLGRSSRQRTSTLCFFTGPTRTKVACGRFRAQYPISSVSTRSSIVPTSPTRGRGRISIARCGTLDRAGSKCLASTPPGSKWAIGTELHLVNRLAKEHPDKLVVSVDPNMCLCTTMNRIDLQHLCWVMDSLVEGSVVNQVQVPPEIAEGALAALNRMLAIT